MYKCTVIKIILFIPEYFIPVFLDKVYPETGYVYVATNLLDICKVPL